MPVTIDTPGKFRFEVCKDGYRFQIKRKGDIYRVTVGDSIPEKWQQAKIESIWLLPSEMREVRDLINGLLGEGE